MATLAYDPNQPQNSTGTNVLAEGNNSAENSYVSNGNPYGQYATPSISSTSSQPQQQTQQNASRKSNTGASSGQHTNVQTYVDKNKQSSQQLGQAVENKLQNTADLVRQNTQNVNQKFQQNVNQGSLENWETAVDRSKQAFQQASQSQAPQQNYVSNEAKIYNPTANQQPDKSGIQLTGNDNAITMNQTYSPEDQALIDSNMARVIFGDGTSKDFATQSEAQTAINDWNKQNPGYYNYGDQEQLSLSDKELSDILNAQYQGPRDLYQTQGYNDLFNQVNEAQALQDLASGSGYKGELLRQTFSNPNTQYTQGQKLLDDMLLGQGSVNESLKQKAGSLGQSPTGQLSDDFSKTVKDARSLASERTKAMEDVRTGSRSVLDETAQAREAEINNRLNDVLANWEKYPDYFREKFTQSADSAKQTTAATNQYNDAKKNVDSITAELNKWKERAKDTMRWGTEKPQKEIANLQNQLASANKALSNSQQQLQSLSQPNISEGSLGLSQLEAEMLGIQGGEGIYDLLSKGGIDSLIRTGQSDINKLISRDEQNQLSRLQSIAELADDYGSVDSGINFLNKFTNQDLAGTQTALDALDLDYLRDQLQGRESQFRSDADSSNITGYGRGKATSGGALGTKKKTAEKYLTQNLGDLLESSGGYRNMYSDEGVNQDTVNQILGLAKGTNTGEFGTGSNYGLSSGSIGNVGGGSTDAWNPLTGSYLAYGDVAGRNLERLGEGYTNLVQDAFGNNVVSDILGGTQGKIVGEIGRGLSNVASGVNSALFGSSEGLKEKAQAKANAAAVSDLKNKINQSLNNQGYSNQFNVINNQQRDLELLQLLGLLDTTNR